jgi:hypothetical protein
MLTFLMIRVNTLTPVKEIAELVDMSFREQGKVGSRTGKRSKPERLRYVTSRAPFQQGPSTNTVHKTFAESSIAIYFPAWRTNPVI